MKKTHQLNKIWFLLWALFCLVLFAIISVHCFGSKTTLNENLSTKFGLAHIFAFPVLFGIVGIVCTLVIIVLLIWKSAHGVKSSWFSYLLCLLMIVSFTVLAFAGNSTTISTAETLQGRSFKFVEWNALNSINQDSAKTIFLDYDADIAIFPEFGGYSKGENSNQRVQDIFEEAGINIDLYDVFTSAPTAGSIAPVTVIIKKDFATYELMAESEKMTMYGTMYLRTDSKGLPDIVGLHTSPPMPGMMDYWRRDIELISNLAEDTKYTIIAGDFNATMRHGALNSITTHYDALEALSTFERGTWPVKLPALFRASIDHILLPESCSVKTVDIRSLNSSDHAAIFTEIIVNP